MPNVYLDKIELLSVIERNGVITGLTRKARVTFTPDEIAGLMPFTTQSLTQTITFPPGGGGAFQASPDGILDVKGWRILTAALEVCPRPYSLLDFSGMRQLVLVERTPTLVENDGVVVDVTLKYEHVLSGPNQLFSDFDVSFGFGPTPNAFTRLYGKGRCSITQKKTNFYWPPGVARTPANRMQILVGHHFDPTDVQALVQTQGTSYPDITDPKRQYKALPLGYGIQGGEVSVPFPQGNFTMQGAIVTSNPWLTAQLFIAKVNVNTWMNQPPRTWICSEVQWDVLQSDFRDPTKQYYKYVLEFQNNSDTWDVDVVYLDRRTGKPPAKVQPGTIANPIEGGMVNLQPTNLTPQQILGIQVVPPVAFPADYWKVPFLDAVDFEELFGAYFEGGVPPPEG